ncbi:DUF1960-domain-containing protein [Ascodesmis nigricans]|uniref:DUF1960-domain-containing protein n=1 Tax=Ascodesmis nigricans TaxID=341454 RepID=A0A4S2MKC3_9PEZI|nr:DUF1960-domain-containing protein [Ascodesmis nigricans]
MARGKDQPQTKIVFPGKSDDFIVMAESVDTVEKWKKDPSIPVVDVVDGWQVFCTHKQGAQGIMDAASNAALDNEFGSHKLDDVIPHILKNGQPQHAVSREKYGDKNPSIGSLGGWY